MTGFWENGQVILSRKRIMERYTSSWLLFDLIAAIPFNLITFFSSLKEGNVNYQLFKSIENIW